MDIRELVKGIHDCPCGKDHSCPTETVEIGSGVLTKLPQLCAGYEKLLLVADQNTYRIGGEAAEKLLWEKLENKVVYQAGVGDILGKHSCLNDWKLSALIHGEYFCQKVYDLVYEAVNRVQQLIEAAVSREEEALGALMEALVAVGFEMSFVGNSRPASGSEHHLSHFFEITGILDDKPYFCHGIDVIYSAVVTAKLREKVLSSQPKPYHHDAVAWEKEIRRLYSTSSDEVIKLQNKMGWYYVDGYQNVCHKWEKICQVLAEAPTEAQMLEMVRRIGLDYSEFVKLYGQKKIDDAVLYAKDLKDRYTVLWLAYQHC